MKRKSTPKCSLTVTSTMQTDEVHDSEMFQDSTNYETIEAYADIQLEEDKECQVDFLCEAKKSSETFVCNRYIYSTLLSPEISENK